jgi:response regulator RpfG family c-di-GMP phosphodiesterase
MTKTFLLIDHDPDDSEIFRDALMAIDPSINFMSATHKEEALQLAVKDIFLLDMIFLNLKLAGTSAQECLSELKKIRRLKNIPVILFLPSAKSSQDDENMSVSASFFLTKPCSFNDICKTLSSLINTQMQLSE